MPTLKQSTTRETSTAAGNSFLTLKELQARWKVCQMTIWRLRRQGRIKAYKLAHRGLRFSLAEIERLEREAGESEPSQAA